MLTRIFPQEDIYVESIISSSPFGWLTAWQSVIPGIDTPLKLNYSFQLTDNNVEKIKTSNLFIPQENITPFSEIYQKMTQWAFKKWENVADVSFIQNDINYQILFIEANLPDSENKTNAYVVRNETQYHLNMEGIKLVKPYDFVWLVFNRNKINAIYTEYQSPVPVLKTAVHEVGHILRFDHSYEYFKKLKSIPIYVNNTRKFNSESYSNSTTTSIMNHNPIEFYFQYDWLGKRLLKQRKYFVLSPTEYDIRAAHISFGKNKHTGLGDNTYSFLDYQHSLEQFGHHNNLSNEFFILETIYDENGINTLSAAGIKSHSIINLNSGMHYRSKITTNQLNIHFSLVGNFHHVVAGEQSNEIFLNNFNNTIDISLSNSTSKIITTFWDTGHDMVLGFNPKKDQILFEKILNATAPMWEISKFENRVVHINSQILNIPFGTEITLQNGSMSLAGVMPFQISRQQLKIYPVNAAIFLGREHTVFDEKQMQSVKNNQVALITNYDAEQSALSFKPDISHSELNEDLLEIFSSSFLQNFGASLSIQLFEKLLRKYDISEAHIENAYDVLNFLCLLSSNSWLAQSAGLLTTNCLRYFQQSPACARWGGFAATQAVELGSEYIASGQVTTGITRLAGRTLGYTASHLCTFFGSKIIKAANDYLEPCDVAEIKLDLTSTYV